MASNTPNLDLLKKNPITDGNDTFNIQTMLNVNWDKVDEAVGNKVDKVQGKGLSTEDYTAEEKNKLANIQDNANNYVHPANHLPSVITQDSNNRFVTDAEKNIWNGKQNTLGYIPENVAKKGAVNGYAELGADGKVPSFQLPSFVDDVLEYTNFSSLSTTGETGKIYITLDNNKTYRWSGSSYAEISQSLAIGETSATAYRGDRGKIAYDHSQASHAPSDSWHPGNFNPSSKLDTTAKAADSEKVDGINGASLLRSDADDNVTAHTEWQDGKEVRFGNSADMCVLHTSNNNYMRLYNGFLAIMKDTSEYIAKFIRDGAVELFYNNVKRLETKLDGVKTIGTHYADKFMVGSDEVLHKGNILNALPIEQYAENDLSVKLSDSNVYDTHLTLTVITSKTYIVYYSAEAKCSSVNHMFYARLLHNDTAIAEMNNQPHENGLWIDFCGLKKISLEAGDILKIQYSSESQYGYMRRSRIFLREYKGS